ncbi:MAG TPA: hypothetical protein DDZ04_09655 [Parabacteroides sp.]|nr:hypothetical protein [Parabacteroides sp.]
MLLDEVWIYRKPVARVRCSWLGYLLTHLLPVLAGYPAEAVTAYRAIAHELPAVHLPYLGDAHA